MPSRGASTAFVSLLAVALLVLLEKASLFWSRRTASCSSPPLSVVVARLHLWTLCLFRVPSGLGSRRDSPAAPSHSGPVRAALASSLPGLGAVSLEYVYMKATQPSDPLFALFEKQPLSRTLEQTVLSIFSGRAGQHAFMSPQGVLFVVLCIGLPRRPRGRDPAGPTFPQRSLGRPTPQPWPPARSRFRWPSLSASATLSTAGYQVPLFAALFYAVGRGLTTRMERLLALSSRHGGVRSPASDRGPPVHAKSNNGEIARLVLAKSEAADDGRDRAERRGLGLSGAPPCDRAGLLPERPHPKEAPIPI